MLAGGGRVGDDDAVGREGGRRRHLAGVAQLCGLDGLISAMAVTVSAVRVVVEEEEAEDV